MISARALSIAAITTAVTLMSQSGASADANGDWARLVVQYKMVRGAMEPEEPSPVRSASSFGDSAVVNCTHPLLLDLKSNQLQAVSVDGAQAIISTADDGKGNKYALAATADKKLAAFVCANGKWRKHPLPDELQKALQAKPEEHLLTGDAGTVVVIAANDTFINENGKWRTLPAAGAKKEKLCYRWDMSRAVMRDGRLYYGISAGEWGGGVNKVDTTTGATTQVLQDAMQPVSDLKFGPDGKLWFVVGGAHMGLRSAALYSYDGHKLQSHCRAQGMYIPKVKAEKVLSDPSLLPAAINDLSRQESSFSKRENWDLLPSTFTGLDFDSTGAPVVSAIPYGLLRFKGEKWEQLTKDWPEAVSPADVVIKSGMAVVPVRHHGVVTFDMNKKTYRFLFPQKP
ncbi:MAG: hypothetical protein U0105_26175 [Candidatus Obscuribacterales bacterium]